MHTTLFIKQADVVGREFFHNGRIWRVDSLEDGFYYLRQSGVTRCMNYFKFHECLKNRTIREV